MRDACMTHGYPRRAMDELVASGELSRSTTGQASRNIQLGNGPQKHPELWYVKQAFEYFKPCASHEQREDGKTMSTPRRRSTADAFLTTADPRRHPHPRSPATPPPRRRLCQQKIDIAV